MGTEEKRLVIPLPWKPPYNADAQQSLMVQFLYSASGENSPGVLYDYDLSSEYWYIEAATLLAAAEGIIPQEVFDDSGFEVICDICDDERFVPVFEGEWFPGKVDGKDVIFAAASALKKHGYISKADTGHAPSLNIAPIEP